MNLVVFVPSPKFIPEEIIEDPFDNLFLALASENKAHLIISGDNHLLDLKECDHIQIVTPAEACKVIEIEKGGVIVKRHVPRTVFITLSI